MMHNLFNTLQNLDAGSGSIGSFYSLPQLERAGVGRISRLPVSIRIVLESVLRNFDGRKITEEDVRTLANWEPDAERTEEIPFVVARALLQDFTGVPLLVDLAAMRSAARRMGRDPRIIEPLTPVDLVIDHSVQVDFASSPDAFRLNMEMEFRRNAERYKFLKWGEQAFQGFRVIPPGIGICHQVNLEYLANGVLEKEGVYYPDTLVGTDSHTTMINGLGIVGWGVGGIEAEAAMLGQPVYFLTPDVVGVHMSGRLRPGVTATDLVLHVTEMLRRAKVVGKFVEFHGEGTATLSAPDRATIGNMAPEYGATIGYFPVDEKTCEYLLATGRSEEHVKTFRSYFEAQGLFGIPRRSDIDYTTVLELDLAEIEPSVSGPRRPQDRIELSNLGERFMELLRKPAGEGGYGKSQDEIGRRFRTTIGAGKEGLEHPLAGGGEQSPETVPLGAGHIGSSGPLDPRLEEVVTDNDVIAASVLSGNRNFEARIHQSIKANFLMSPPLVVAFALAGRVDIDLTGEPVGKGENGEDVFLRDIWPSLEEINELMSVATDAETYRRLYSDFAAQNPLWDEIPVVAGKVYDWDRDSTYIQEPPYFEDFAMGPGRVSDIRGARSLAIFGDSVTTDHISPAGAIKPTAPAGLYLQEKGVRVEDFNSYGSRRGNHEVMVRGTFANVRIKNLMAPGTEGGFTIHQPSREQMTIYEAATRYGAEGVPLVIFAGEEYGAGSSRDWAAKGTRLLGARAVITRSFERIHRSNLVGMGVLPLQFMEGTSAQTLRLDGAEVFDLVGLEPGIEPRGRATLVVTRADGATEEIPLIVRIDTPVEIDYYTHGGVLPFVLRNLLAKEANV